MSDRRAAGVELAAGICRFLFGGCVCVCVLLGDKCDIALLNVLFLRGIKFYCSHIK